MNVDQILRQIGEFGAYQKTIYTILNLLGVTHGIRMFMAVFMVYVPNHRCAIPSYPNDTYEVQSPYHADLIQRFIPNSTKDDKDEAPYDRCHMYAGGGLNDTLGLHGTKIPIVGCNRWVYDTSVIENSAVVEFDMVCDDVLLSSHSQTSQMAGFLFGVLFFGAIGDKFGRKVAIYLPVVLYLAGGLGLSWSPQAGYAVFVLLRFFNGACSAGAYTAVYVLSVEMVGPNKRLWVGVFIHLTFASGGMVLDFIGYFERDWALINIIGTAPVILALSFWWIIPESPRWLAKKGRVKEAEVILRRVAKYNGKLFPEDLLPGANVDQKSANSNEAGGVYKRTNQNSSESGGVTESANPAVTKKGGVATNADQQDNQNRSVVRDFFRMFTYRVLLTRNLILYLNWFATSMAFYGLSFTAGELPTGGLFTNFLLSASMELPAVVLVLLLLDRWGRRPLHCSMMITGGVACLLGVLTTMVVSEGLQWMTVVVAMVGKLGSSAGFILIYIYSSELHPTIVRSAGLGVSSAFARVGSIVASYVQQWSLDMGGDFGHALPLLVFGVFSLAGGVTTLGLPETLHKDLPDTIEDGLVFGQNPSKDEHVDPQKVVEVFSIDNVQITMDTYRTPDVTSAPNNGVVEGKTVK